MSDSTQQQTQKSLEVALDTIALNPNMPMEMRLGVASQVILELSQRPNLLRGRRWVRWGENTEPMRISQNPEDRSWNVYVAPSPEDQRLIDIACDVVREAFLSSEGATEGLGMVAWDALHECVNPSVLNVSMSLVESRAHSFNYAVLRYPLEFLRHHAHTIFSVYQRGEQRRGPSDEVTLITCLTQFAIENDEIYERFKRSFRSTRNRRIKAHLCLAIYEIDKAREKRKKKSKRAKPA